MHRKISWRQWSGMGALPSAPGRDAAFHPPVPEVKWGTFPLAPGLWGMLRWWEVFDVGKIGGCDHPGLPGCGAKSWCWLMTVPPLGLGCPDRSLLLLNPRPHPQKSPVTVGRRVEMQRGETKNKSMPTCPCTERLSPGLVWEKGRCFPLNQGLEVWHCA